MTQLMDSHQEDVIACGDIGMGQDGSLGPLCFPTMGCGGITPQPHTVLRSSSLYSTESTKPRKVAASSRKTPDKTVSGAMGMFEAGLEKQAVYESRDQCQ